MELDEVRVVRLPEGKDPDEVIRDEPDLWREEVRTAQPIVDYLIDVHARAYDLRTPGGKARFVDAVMPTIRGLPEPGAARRLPRAGPPGPGVEERTLLEAMHRRRRDAGRRAAVAAATGSSRRP